MIPPCHNRPPRAAGQWLPTGRHELCVTQTVSTHDHPLFKGEVAMRFKPRYRWHRAWSPDRCATHDGKGIGPNGESYPQAHGWDCRGCRWLPDNVRSALHRADAWAKFEAHAAAAFEDAFFRVSTGLSTMPFSSIEPRAVIVSPSLMGLPGVDLRHPRSDLKPLAERLASGDMQEPTMIQHAARCNLNFPATMNTDDDYCDCGADPASKARFDADNQSIPEDKL